MNEDAVNLHLIQRQLLQVRQRGVSGAEIVECEACAELAYPLQHLRSVLRILHHHGFGKFKLERASLHDGSRQD